MKYPTYCINLEHREDRKAESLKQFSKLNILAEDVIYPSFVKDSRGGAYGCFDSHIKIWNDFFIKYPNNNYCLIFEDDFIITDNSVQMLNDAEPFINKNYNAVDILNLHDLRINVKNILNDENFTNGYGLATHAYFITRSYIQNIISRYGKLPESDGQHIDIVLNFKILHPLYTTKIFYTNIECIKQNPICESDNCKNKLDDFFRNTININTSNKIALLGCSFGKKFFNLNDDELKKNVSLLLSIYKNY